MDYIAALRGAPLLLKAGVRRTDAIPTGQSPSSEVQEPLTALCERLEKQAREAVPLSDLSEIQHARLRLAAEKEAGADAWTLKRLSQVCDQLEAQARVNATPGIISKGDPRLHLRLEGLNGLEAMEAMIQEMGYDVGSGTDEDS
mmetsp:Transcript_47721/g.118213  ORF Transcript_47721/g.118213 Transcript_47721/m.118213 type:complete len:144 (-) Transcript_47721:93-524(-)